MKKQILIIAAILLLANSMLWISLTVPEYQEQILMWLNKGEGGTFWGFALINALISHSFMIGIIAFAAYMYEAKRDLEKEEELKSQNS